MDMGLNYKTVVMTGRSKGIGKGIAKEGAHVVIWGETSRICRKQTVLLNQIIPKW
ncbi:hypothetical protein MUO14_01270 [Halobacillus shinanisalinarum]|uniref:SDR family NAD(P)-dependent oxidoreductase n=1 Tax=Halobacillus shinanisalinarum TaxID=2932258 RepID=A0ABY4H3V7_9BACI|nr:hypothetical protein [Halobacillus shinanisalinarum]UOQ93667.1 hypothetical protein MUO14_01270 [Halobacillus shinanisalinarum]